MVIVRVPPFLRDPLRHPGHALEAVASPLLIRDLQVGERRVLQEGYLDHDLVFATPHGSPLDVANVRKRLMKTLSAGGIAKSYTFHSLRYAAATLMLVAGVSPKVAADRLGHHSAAFTLDRYTHAVQSLDEDAADRLQTVLRRL